MIGLLVRLAVSAGLIFVLLRNIAWADVGRLLAGADYTYLGLALASLAGFSLVQAQRWRVVLATQGAKLSFLDSWRIVYIGMFFNQTLPSAIGGDAMRMWEARRIGLSLRSAITSIVVDRLVGLAAVIVMIVAGAAHVVGLVADERARLGYLGATAAVCLGFIVLLALAPIWPAKWRRKPFDGLVKLSEDARSVFLVPGPALLVLGISVAIQIGLGLVVKSIALGLGIEVALQDCILLFSPVILFSTLPISLAGWGVRESAMVVMFGLVGVATADAFALSLVFGLTNIVLGLPGGLLWLQVRGKAGASAEVEAPQSTISR
ncbi:MAG: flippase-like domain-containing protein [Alphaproteobacteria bacterium]|nr:flippase-like domain-containing protein [Alphaproteobacteria bacterium]